MIDRFAHRDSHHADAAVPDETDDAQRRQRLLEELREFGLAAPTPRPDPAGRDELHSAVLARAAELHRPGTLSRVRGATYAVAAIAGAGLVVASAASGSNPAVLVVDVARDLPHLTRIDPPPATVAIEGEVVASYDSGRTLELRSDAGTILVEVPRAARDVTAAGTPVAPASIEQGVSIRVTAERDASPGTVTAKRIEVLPPALAAATDVGSLPATPVPADRNAGPTTTANTVTAIATPRPAGTPRPSLTKSPVLTANETIVAALPPILATRTPTPKPTTPPTWTSTKAPSSTPVPTNDTRTVTGSDNLSASDDETP